MATLSQVLDQMAAADMPPLPPGHPIADGKLRRFGGREKKCWYVLFDVPTRSGKRVLAGAFGRWQGNDNGKIVIKSDWTGVAADEMEMFRKSQEGYEAREREKRQARARFAGNRAVQQWNAGRARLAEGEALPPYLAKKRLQWENGLRLYTDGTLLVPMVRYDVDEKLDEDPAYTGPRRLAGLQKIKPDGFKLFNKGMDPTGAACRFGRKPKDGDLLMVGEGLATVLSVFQGLERQYTAYISFVAGNLERIAKMLRAQFPSSPILFLADDDAYLEAQLNKRLRNDYLVKDLYKVLDAERTMASKYGPLIVRADLHEDPDGAQVMTAGIRFGDQEVRTLVMRNTGRTKARAAAAAIGNAWVVCPQFEGRVLALDPDAPRLTDFNDLHVSEGIGKVVEQVGNAISSMRDAIELAQALRTGTPTPRDGASGGKGGGGEVDELDWRLHSSLIKRFTLIERSDMAWDAERGFMWRTAHMRLTFGGRPVAAWLGSKRRRSVDLSQVVFDPTGAADPKTTVNLFRGLSMKPSEVPCDKLLKLARYLCGEDESTETPISDWLLKWFAYMVQHVGAKMKTAIVMHGPEGTGKNLLWSAMEAIFAPYSVVIGQLELEDKHNTWQSAKLLVVANEVVTRSEMSHHVGRLKALVTDPKLNVNPKFQDSRYEDNFMNLGFLSNEFQPLRIAPGDRRYMVIRTPSALPDVFYKEVAAELRAGGAAGFMHYLLKLELGDFNEHTKPIMTDAKRDLIELGMLPSQQFWQEIKDGLLQLPYCPALSDDVYRAYTIWCGRRGHKMPEAQPRFTPSFMSMNGVTRREPRVADPEKLHELQLARHKLKKRRVFFMGPRCSILHLGEDKPTAYDSENEWVAAGLKAFRMALRAYEAEEPAGLRGTAQARQESVF